MKKITYKEEATATTSFMNEVTNRCKKKKKQYKTKQKPTRLNHKTMQPTEAAAAGER